MPGGYGKHNFVHFSPVHVGMYSDVQGFHVYVAYIYESSMTLYGISMDGIDNHPATVGPSRYYSINNYTYINVSVSRTYYVGPWTTWSRYVDHTLPGTGTYCTVYQSSVS